MSVLNFSLYLLRAANGPTLPSLYMLFYMDSNKVQEREQTTYDRW